jgi:serine protease AprX
MQSSSQRPVHVAFGKTLAALAISLATAVAAVGPARALSLPSLPTGLSQIVTAYGATAVVRGIAEFGAVPTSSQVAALRGLGLVVQPMRHVPLALVFGPVSAIQAAVTSGTADDVYPDDPIELLDTASSDTMGGAAARAAGFTGKGVTVAVVDSGCDASHPDLADHVVHNVKLYSGEYANLAPDSSSTIVVANETGPYQNTDIGGGHGTHVAGIIAADSTTDPSGGRLGVAPDASLVCFSVGEALFTSAVTTAYDYMLDQPDLWGIRMVNNSWGNSYRMFDPRDPVAIVTKAVSDLGVVVVFAAGNSGYSEAEMSLNPFSEAPWVISVAAGTLSHGRAEFSSNGLIFDNSEPVTIGAGGHTVYTGDRIGVYHPDVTAPGDSISSTCSTAGVVVPACPPPDYGNATESGMSMAAPHVAGAAAVLLQANPNLTPDQVRIALQATATPVTRFGASTNAPFWQVGYGYVDLAAAITLVRSKGWAKDLPKAQARADARVLAEDGFKAIKGDFWTYDSPRLALVGTTDSRTYTTTVGLGVTHIKVAFSHPSLAVLGANGTEYTVTVRDAAGRVIGTTVESPLLGAGTSYVLIDLRAISPAVALGTFSFDVSGDLAASDPDTLDSDSLLGRMNTLSVVQLAPG